MNNNRNLNFKPFSFTENKSTFRSLDDEPIMTPQGNYSLNGIEPLPLMDSSRRDNTIIIKDYYVEDYRKKEVTADTFRGTRMEGFNTSMDANIDAGLASGVRSLVQLSNNHNRALANVGRFKNNDYDDETMYLRPENIDGKPINDLLRIRQKTQSEIRSDNPNSQRADLEGTNVESGQHNRGTGQNPSNITLTQTRTQNRELTEDDRIAGRGHTTAPENRPKIQESKSSRSNEQSYIGPGSDNRGGEVFLSDDIKNREFFSNNKEEENTYMGPASVTIRSLAQHGIVQSTKYEKEHTYTGHAHGNIGIVYMNGQDARGGDTSTESNYIGHGQSRRSGMVKENYQPARDTSRENVNENLGIASNQNNGYYYHNNQDARPTDRETNTNYIGSGNDSAQGYVYMNGQQANPTQRQMTGETNYIGQSQITHGGIVKENYQPARDTGREIQNENLGIANNQNTGYYYYNGQDARPTDREYNTNYVGSGTDSAQGYVYMNGQQANNTNRENTSTQYSGVSFNSKSTYLKQTDETRPSMVDEVMMKDYKGHQSSIGVGQSRDHVNNFTSDDRREIITNIQNRELPPMNNIIGTGVENYGQSTTDTMRENNTSIQIPKAINTNSYQIYDYNVRNKETLNARNNINPYITTVNNGNPYVNNLVHKGYSNNDVIRETTLLSDRVISK